MIQDSDHGKRCIVNTHVDDFRGVNNAAPHLVQHLRAILKTRFEEVTDVDTGVFTGIQHTVLANGAIFTHQNDYIARVAGKVGVAHLPPVHNPAGPDFFVPSTSSEDLVPIPPDQYQSLTGSLVQMLHCRDELKHLISHLCSANHRPTAGDYNKALTVLVYLFSTPDIGRVYKFNDPTQIFLHADASFATLPTGHSITANMLTIGPDNAPFSSYAQSQSEVAPDPMSAEYYAASFAVRLYAHFAQLSQQLGFGRDEPATLYLDCQTAINLAVAPEITKKARHMKAKHHYIREASQQGIIDIVHVLSPSMRCDAMSKVFSTAPFKRGRDRLLNISQK
jgi:hypothetical protein